MFYFKNFFSHQGIDYYGIRIIWYASGEYNVSFKHLSSHNLKAITEKFKLNLL
jgi:hypothetical protein